MRSVSKVLTGSVPLWTKEEKKTCGENSTGPLSSPHGKEVKENPREGDSHGERALLRVVEPVRVSGVT